MRLRLLCVGRLGDRPEALLARDYAKRAGVVGRPLGLGPVEIVEVESRKPGRTAEAAALLARLGEARLVACDEHGMALASAAFAERLAAWRDGGARQLAFMIGGADGLDPDLLARADHRLAFGPQTWPHALARVMLAEQIYRAGSLLAGAPIIAPEEPKETIMPLLVRQFACLSDNYGFLARDAASGQVACVDTPDAEAILAALAREDWRLDLILNTHWHPDHAGGNARLRAETGAAIVGPAEVRRIAPLDREVGDGDTVDLGETRFAVIETGGHTLGHVAYHSAADQLAFVGDTLFALGCGRLFEGTAAQMWASLARLAALPEATTVYCAHEYTAANARFALSIDSSPELKARAQAVFAARERGEATVPTTIGAERATNPFLRASLLASDVADPVAAFAQLRAAKDAFRG